MLQTLHMERITRRGLLRVLLASPLLALALPRKADAGLCDDTTADILGPFYAEKAPFRTVLASESEPGQRLFISGAVRAEDCQTPIGDALVEVWQANEAGCYSIHQACEPGEPDADPFNLRASMVTGPEGEYAFETILPGHYGDGTLRPRHIHFKLTAPDGTVLVTQLYFEGDEWIASDPWASRAPDRIIPLDGGDEGLSGVFDVDLPVDPLTVPEPGGGWLAGAALLVLRWLRRAAAR